MRTASERDLAKVSALLGETWHATYDALYGAAKVEELTEKWHSVPALKARLARKDAEFVVADNGKDIGGMGYAAMSETLKKGVVLHQLYVHPSFQRQGIGRDMFAELETCFPDAEFMQLEVDPQNRAALSFYEGLGFRKIGETSNCGDGQSGIAAIIMEKPLSS